MPKKRANNLKKKSATAKRKLVVLACVLICLALSVSLMAQWNMLPRTSKRFALAAAQSNAIDPNSPSKEYIYAGGRLIATEEPGPNPTPPPDLPPTPTPTPAPVPRVVISQIYGGGGNAGATYKNDFIELFNGTGSSVDLTGWSVQYSAAGSTNWQITTLNGSLAPGQYLLIQEAQGSGGTVDLPTPDVVGTDELNASAGKVALVNNSSPLSGACPSVTAGIVDLVGYGASAGCFEGSGPTASPSNTQAVIRASGGCIDVNDNATDFAPGSPLPRNSGSVQQNCSNPTGSTGVVISEFRTRGINGGNDEFIELYNKSNAPADISGWKIKGSSNAGSVSVRVTINANTILPPGGRYLVTNTNGYGGSLQGNQTYSLGISDDGGIALTTGSDQIVDQVGMSNGSAFKEGRVLSPLTVNSDRSYERKPGGTNGSTQDTDDNLSDFALRTPSEPQR